MNEAIKESEPAPDSQSSITDKLKKELAVRLKEANTSGVTSWLGLGKRLDAMVLIDIDNYRVLLRQALTLKLENPEEEGVEGEKREVAKGLLEALNEYEASLAENDDVA